MKNEEIARVRNLCFVAKEEPTAGKDLIELQPIKVRVYEYSRTHQSVLKINEALKIRARWCLLNGGDRNSHRYALCSSQAKHGAPAVQAKRCAPRGLSTNPRSDAKGLDFRANGFWLDWPGLRRIGTRATRPGANRSRQQPRSCAPRASRKLRMERLP